jgi:hypothetical protein
VTVPSQESKRSSICVRDIDFAMFDLFRQCDISY